MNDNQCNTIQYKKEYGMQTDIRKTEMGQILRKEREVTEDFRLERSGEQVQAPGCPDLRGWKMENINQINDRNGEGCVHQEKGVADKEHKH